MKIEFKDSSTGSKADKKIYFIADKDANIDIYSTSQVKKFNFPNEKTTSMLIQLYHLINKKLEQKRISIKSINHPNYQEIYELEGDNRQTAKVSFYYNKKGHIKSPTLMKAEPKQFGTKVIEALTSDVGIDDFDFIGDDWRKTIYTEVYSSLKDDEYQVAHIIQTPYKDTIKITKNDLSLTVDMYYDGDGFFSSIIATHYTDKEVWNYFQLILKALQ